MPIIFGGWYIQLKSKTILILFWDDTDEGTDFAASLSSPAEVANWHGLNAQYPLMLALPAHAAYYYPSAAAAYGETTLTCIGHFTSKVYAKSCSLSRVWNYRYNAQMDGYIATGLGVPRIIESEAIFGVRNVNDNTNIEA